MQYLYEAGETGLTAARSITAFEVRAEQGVASVAKSNIDLQIEMSQTATTMATLNATFATNRGANHTVVFARRLVSLPVTLTATGTFSYSLAVPNQQNLLGGPILGQYAVVSGTPTIDTSPSRRIFLTDLDQIGRVYHNTSNTSLTGTVQTRVALATRLQ